MGLLNTKSLGETVDNISWAFFSGEKLSKVQLRQAADWIAKRQGQTGSYSGMFAPTAKDFADGFKVFTGERVTSQAGVSHMLGQETCRALLKIDDSRKVVREVLGIAAENMAARCMPSDKGHGSGMYCCGKCSVSMWRHLVVSPRPDSQRFLNAGLKALKRHRNGDGKWGIFPFHYTLLALSEIDSPTAIREMKYAAPLCEKLIKRTPRDDKYATRRRTVAQRVLEKI